MRTKETKKTAGKTVVKKTKEIRCNTKAKATPKAVNPAKTTHKQSASSKAKSLIKADELRVQSNKDMRKLNNLINKWEAEKSKAKTQVEKDKVDKKYVPKVQEADKTESKSYKAYYDYVHKNFTKEQIIQAKPYGNFTNKTFINNLKKAQG